MSSEGSQRWKRIDQIFAAAVEQPADELASFLDQACGGDRELQKEVVSLLDADRRASGFLERPAVKISSKQFMCIADRVAKERCRRQEAAEASLSGTIDNERYRVVRKLGAGGMGVVYQVEDRERGEMVALKMLRGLDPERLFRLKREFRWLTEVNHPNLVNLYELVVSDDSCYFTMELIEGTSFLGYVSDAASFAQAQTPIARRLQTESSESGATTAAFPLYREVEREKPIAWPTCDEGRLRQTLPQLVRGVAVLHEAGKVHRDIKPSNIMVGAGGRLVLLDFGLVAQVDEEAHSLDGHIIGTAAYMAPEQCFGEKPAPAADWYSVGVVLYEALTGRVPFRGPLTQVILEKQRYLPAPPRALVPGVPQDLDELCVDLLARNPEERPTQGQIVRRLGIDAGAAASEISSSAPTATRVGPFSGRRLELARLGRGFASLADERAHAVLVWGASGIGKSTLVRKLLVQERGHRSDLVILEGRCYECETVPYQAIDSLIDNLCRYWRHLPAVQAAALLPREAALLSRLFPVLDRVPAIADSPRVREISDPQELRTRAFGALRETLQRLGERCQLLLFLDDMQWADANTLFLLKDLMRPPDPPRLFLILAGRPESRSTLTELIAAMDAVTDVLSLEALPAAAATELAGKLLGPDATHLAERVATEAAGNPFFVVALAQYLQTTNHSSLDSVRLEDVLSRRIQGLGEAARRVLEIAALAGAHLTRRTLRHATGLDKKGLARELGVLRTLKLLRTTGGRRANRLEPYHDRIRDATLATLSKASRQSHHRALALALEGQASAEQLAYHWRGAGDHDRAAEHAEAAAHEALARLDFDRAANLYRMALGLGRHQAPQQRTLTLALGEALAHAGRPAEAAAAFRTASEEAEPAERLELQRLSAEALLRGGYLEAGLQEIREVLASIGFQLAETPIRAGISLVLRRLLLRLHGLRWRECAVDAVPPRTLSRVDICWSVTAGLCFADPIRAAEYQARHLLMALRAGERSRIARALAIETSYLATQGAQRARRVGTLTKQLAAAVDDPHVNALFLLSGAYIDYYLDNAWRQALHRFKQAEELLRRQGGSWELDSARLWSCYSQIYLGQLAELAHSVPSYARAGERRGDRYLTVNLQTRANLVWLVRDDVDGARQELDRAMQSWIPASKAFQLQHFFALMAGCEIAMYGGNPGEAAVQMKRTLPPLRGSLLPLSPMVRLETVNLQVRIALALAAESDHEKRRSLLREANRHVRSLQRMRLPLAQALVPLYRAGMANLAGDTYATEAHLRQAVAALDQLETMLYANGAKRRLAELVGGQEGAELLDSSDAWMKRQGAQNPARLTAMLAPGWLT